MRSFLEARYRRLPWLSGRYRARLWVQQLMRHEPRAATIMASADTDLMYLVSTDYDRILRADQTLQAERKLKFLIKLPVFRDFDEYVPSPIQHSCCLSSVHLI